MDFSLFKDASLARRLIANIDKLCPSGGATLMEVCGTHTVSIARAGIRSKMPEGLRLISGPGCPVCVTSNHDIDACIAISRAPGVIVTTFGDMMRVPGSTSTLAKEKASGADVRVVYSPLDAVRIAMENPASQVVFIGVGFETTTPAVAAAIEQAGASDVENFSVFCAHKTMPAAIEAIVNSPDVEIDALILPGHVSTIIGTAPYEFLASRYGIAGVVVGFEPVDILQGIAAILRQLESGSPHIEIAYVRGVKPEGNRVARELVSKVFEPCDSSWRGIGPIRASGLRLKGEYRRFDALERIEPDIEQEIEHKGCRCGEVLRGVMAPTACPLFSKACNPENPIGPCMVSSEGSCSAYYRYRDVV